MPSPPARILIVEDEGIGARHIQTQLEDMDYAAVRQAMQGEQAIAQVVRTQLALPVVFLTAIDAGPQAPP